MKEFMLLFRNKVGEGSYSVSPEQMQAAMPKWQAWIGELVSKGQFVSTQPLDYQGKLIRPGSVTDGPYVEVKEIVVGFLICKVDSIEEAVEIGKKCPILDYTGGSLEVRNVTPFSV
ncbi:MAG: YciI family protein [Leptospiraceae bacterium]|nr:YciI family protein [Leptospiraceae bacterium]